MQTKIIIIIGIIVIIIGIIIFQNNDMKVNQVKVHNDDIQSYEISPGDVVKKIEKNEDIVLLDVRTPEEYKEIHLQNAILLPVQELSLQSLEAIGLGEDAKDKEIIIYCRSGGRSKTAYDIMSSLGYTNIKSVSGGMIHWQEDEYPFTKTGEYVVNEIKDDVIGNGPKIILDRAFHDFGAIPQYGGVVETTFIIKNEGNETLTTGDITTSCSCTNATIASSSILEGEETILSVIFDPDFHEEPLDVFKRTIFIPTNDPTKPEVEIVIQVDIKEGE